MQTKREVGPKPSMRLTNTCSTSSGLWTTIGAWNWLSLKSRTICCVYAVWCSFYHSEINSCSGKFGSKKVDTWPACLRKRAASKVDCPPLFVAQDIEGKVQRLHDEHGFAIIELQFLYDALRQVRACRRVLKWTYVYGYYLDDCSAAGLIKPLGIFK